MFAFKVSRHKLLYTGYLASFTTTMQICDWSYCSSYILFDFLCGKESKCGMKLVGRAKGTTVRQLVSQIPCSTTHFVTRVTSERRIPITRPIYKERTYLSTSIRMAFQQRNGPRTAEILVIHMMSRQTLLWFCKQPWNSQAAATSLSWESSE